MTSFLKGALAGATLAFLYAPQRGEQTRARVRTEVEALLARLEAGVREATAGIAERLDELRDRAADLVEAEPDDSDGYGEA